MHRSTAFAIAMAAKETALVDVKSLMQALFLWGGEALDEKLPSISAADLKKALTELRFERADTLSQSTLAGLVAVLKRESSSDIAPVQENTASPKESLRIAIASNSGDKLDAHFGSCSRFLVYELNHVQSQLLELRPVPSGRGVDHSLLRANLISDCQLVYVLSIGGPAAASLIRAGVHPIKKAAQQKAEYLIGELQQVLLDGAPPWLEKQLKCRAERTA
ncbi:NifB/NifX family molybdenum-iron cluster-binding protein [Agaribacterium haliotis]|uniref:NifB/NifX family molybdenum-iron cluster-binding protein n=1 Tax=Agaribacterium haliotis TaxID=2013869 RepID=UPI000BB574E0|nr:NifB/NifX family molybdenum-iron cluster-binding protein [Agaribacterium haliotis]